MSLSQKLSILLTLRKAYKMEPKDLVWRSTTPGRSSGALLSILSAPGRSPQDAAVQAQTKVALLQCGVEPGLARKKNWAQERKP